MGFVVTAPTETPLNPDATFDAFTWGESGGPFSVPAAVGPGLGSVVLTSDDYNYNTQKPGRWTRSIVDNTVLSSEGLFASCIVRQGTFNVGGGTLDVTLTATRVVVDASTGDDGGTVMELIAAVGSPETLAALTDNYVELDEAGGVNVLSVANGAGAPAATLGFVIIYKLVTDATELTSAQNVEAIAPVPCLSNVGALSIASPGQISADVLKADSEVFSTVGYLGETAVDPAPLPKGAFVTASETITLDGDANISGGLGSELSVATAKASTFDALSTTGIVKSGNLQFYARAIGSFGTGLVWDGNAFGLADGGAARRWAVPIESFIPGTISTAVVATDTGAEVDIVLAAGETIVIELHTEMTNDGVGVRVNYQITVDAVITGSSGQRYISAAGVYVDASKVTKFTAGAGASYNVKAQYGAAAGTTTARNIMLTVRRSLP